MNYLLELLGASTLLIVGLALIGALVAVYFENGFATSFIVFGGAALILFTTGNTTDPLAWTLEHPLLLGLGVLFYLVFGVVWSVFKYWVYAKDLQSAFAEFKTTFLFNAKVENLTDLSDSQLEEFREKAKNFMLNKTRDNNPYPLRAMDHKADLLFWSCWWPLSLSITLLDEPIRRFHEFVQKRLTRLFERISNDTSKEFRQSMGE